MTSSEKQKSAVGFGPKGSERMDFSGKERDKLFLSARGKEFVDVSYLSGLDSPQDGRVAATADLDHDGDEELIVVYRNAPMLKIHRRNGAGGKFIGLSLRGDGRMTSMDAIGATVTARCDENVRTRVVQVGTGFSTQNAHTQTIGVGACEKVDLTVRFPSGRERVFQQKPTNEMYELEENGPLKHVPGFYARSSAVASTTKSPDAASPGLTFLKSIDGAPAKAGNTTTTFRAKKDLVYVDLWATWCQSCKRDQPLADALATRYGDRIDFVGVTMDEEDTAAKVTEHAMKLGSTKIPLLTLPPDKHKATIASALPMLGGKLPPLPSAMIVDRKTGEVLLLTGGHPTTSAVEALLYRRGAVAQR